MKKIFLWFMLLFSIFIFWSVLAWPDDCPWQWDSEFWCPWDLDREIERQKEVWTTPSWTTGCTYDENGDLSSFLNGCKPKTVVWWWNMQIEGWFKDKINNWIANIALVLWIWAVWALVYAALLLQFANGEDEKIKKSKDIIKWTMIGFILLISASGVIYVVINVMFWLWWE